jgi:geranylgeranyl transferase type-2 subunit beta
LRLNGIYWACTALSLLNKQHLLKRDEVIENVMKCYHPSKGGFGGHPDHDAHLLFTLSAIQILVMYDGLDSIDPTKVMEFIKSLENSDGSFAGDEYGETDTRFSYCAISCASLLCKLNELNLEKAIEYLVHCQNFDGGFGSVAGAESHAGQSK